MSPSEASPLPAPGSPWLWLAIGPILGGLTGSLGSLLTGLGLWIFTGEWFWPIVLGMLGGLFGLGFGLVIGAVLGIIDRDGVPLKRRMITGGLVTFALAMILPALILPFFFSTGFQSPYSASMLNFMVLTSAPSAVLAGVAVAWVIRRDLRGSVRAKRGS